MPLEILRQDIRKIKVDAIVNPTDQYYSGTGGTDKKVHKAAGVELDDYCQKLERLKTGEAVITPAFKMDNCKYIIHTVGPVYSDGKHGESKYLEDCYRNALKLVKDNKLESVALPLISTGTFNYPKKEAMKIATDVISDFIYENDVEVYLLVYDKEAFDISEKLYKDVKDYLKEWGYDDEDKILYSNSPKIFIKSTLNAKQSYPNNIPDFKDYVPKETFHKCLLRYLNEKQIDDKDAYKQSNLSRQLFYGLINDGKIPKRNTVLALAVGLKLNIDEAVDLINKAGYSFDRNKTDAVVRFYIEHGMYDIEKLNKHLASMYLDQLGSRKYSL